MQVYMLVASSLDCIRFFSLEGGSINIDNHIIIGGLYTMFKVQQDRIFAYEFMEDFEVIDFRGNSIVPHWYASSRPLPLVHDMTSDFFNYYVCCSGYNAGDPAYIVAINIDTHECLFQVNLPRDASAGDKCLLRHGRYVYCAARTAIFVVDTEARALIGRAPLPFDLGQNFQFKKMTRGTVVLMTSRRRGWVLKMRELLRFAIQEHNHDALEKEGREDDDKVISVAETVIQIISFYQYVVSISVGGFSICYDYFAE